MDWQSFDERQAEERRLLIDEQDWRNEQAHKDESVRPDFHIVQSDEDVPSFRLESKTSNRAHIMAGGWESAGYALCGQRCTGITTSIGTPCKPCLDRWIEQMNGEPS